METRARSAGSITARFEVPDSSIGSGGRYIRISGSSLIAWLMEAAKTGDVNAAQMNRKPDCFHGYSRVMSFVSPGATVTSVDVSFLSEYASPRILYVPGGRPRKRKRPF